ncbi:MAG: hypothetical protein ONB44_00435 [candidate division KSB1 bacterium]|nr:hypothetical protein [candidate division KSB1 bacterium]MDZ7300588.1 hypothetical protein [candidate division KSB1 bacterium]MDZ7309725.1 hypothetical protein [candidate division KSB1 bacterium]
MMKRIFASLLALLAGAGMILVGCESLNGPNSAAEESLSLSESFDVATLHNQRSLLKSAGANTDSANAFFVLHWSKGPKHFQRSDTVRGHASAVAYEKPATLRERNAVGLDMGMVSVVSGADTFDLSKFVSTLFGVRYGMFGAPHGGPKGHNGGKGGPRGGHGGPISNPLTIVNIPFVGSGVYQFVVTGSDKVAAMTLDINAPAKLVQITGPADRDSIDVTKDLTITWEGDAAANDMVLVLAPVRKMKRGHFGGGQPVEPIFQKLNAADGSYTISTQTLQDLVGQSNATALSLHLSQGMHKEITDAKLGKILISADGDDNVLLIIK